MKRPSDLFGDDDLPTTADDVHALREHRPRPGTDWLDELTALAAQAPQATANLRQRRTFVGLPPFEL